MVKFVELEVDQIKKELAKLGRSTTGNKSELQVSLLEALEEEGINFFRHEFACEETSEADDSKVEIVTEKSGSFDMSQMMMMMQSLLTSYQQLQESQKSMWQEIKARSDEFHRELINQLKSNTYRNIEILKDFDSKPKVTENNNSKENVLDETRNRRCIRSHSPDDADNTNVNTEREALSQVQSSIQVVMPECSAEIEKAENEVDGKVEKVPDEIKKVHNEMETVQSEVDEVQTEFDSDPELWKTVHSEVADVQSEFDSDSELWETAQSEVDEVRSEFVPEFWERPTESTSENCELIPAASEVKVGQHIDSCNNFVNSMNFNCKGDILCSGSDDLKIFLWDWCNNKMLHSFKSADRLNEFPYDPGIEYTGMAEFEWLRLNEFPYDPGGYFVVRGQEQI